MSLTLSVVIHGEEGFVKLPSEDFNTYWKEVEDNALLSTSERQVVLQNCHRLLLETVRDFLRYFPELNFL